MFFLALPEAGIWTYVPASLYNTFQGAGQWEKRLCILNYYISSNIEPTGVTNCTHLADKLLLESLQPCEREGAAPICTAPQPSHHASLLCHAVSRSRPIQLPNPAAAQQHRLVMVFPLLKHLT